MNILITGSDGFIGKNLIKYLKTHTDHVIYRFSRNTDLSELENIIKYLKIDKNVVRTFKFITMRF